VSELRRPTGLAELLAFARFELPAEAVRALDELSARLAEPLRIAIAGRVKAGKSTLLNALVGERLAPTGVQERTRFVTSYRWGHAPLVELVFADDSRRQVPFRRIDGALEPTLPDPVPEDLSRLEVAWPTPALRSRTLVDTPGVGGSEEVAARTSMFLGLDPDEPRRADAVLYLLRHRHRDDLAFLEAFNEAGLAASPVTAIGVLSRADEVGGGDLSSLGVAGQVALRYAADPLLRPLCQTVVPVCGLLAEAAGTLTEPEARVLLALARSDANERTTALRSVDDLRDSTVVADVPVEARAALLDRLGMYGMRVACLAIDAGAATADAIAVALRRASGIDDLIEVIERVFGARAGLLTERSIMAGLADLARRHHSGALAGAVEAAMASDRSWRELEAVVALRRDAVDLPDGLNAEAERLLGGLGGSPDVRLGLTPPAGPAERSKAAALALDRWQRRAARPLATPAQVAMADAVVRSIEALVVDT
jgi:hypothetical protein